MLRLHEVPRYPRRVTLFVILRDESGSMSKWRDRQGTFIPELLTALTDSGGPRVAELVYVLYVVVSGGVVTSGFSPLSKTTDPDYKPDGYTPIGQGLMTVADRIDSFTTTELVPNEVTVRDTRVAIISDLEPSDESAEATQAGVARFLEVVKKYKADVQLVGPSESAMNRALATELDVNGHGVMYLDSSDPKAVFKWTFDSLLSASRKLTGSRPRKPR
jgi:hypothetical protein